MVCAGTAAGTARLKYNNYGLKMMLLTNGYENHSRVCSRPSLTFVEVSKRCSGHVRRYRANTILRYIELKFE